MSFSRIFMLFTSEMTLFLRFTELLKFAAELNLIIFQQQGFAWV